MKKLLIALAAVLVTAATYGQGQVNFANRVGAGGSILSVPVTITGTQDGPGQDYSAQLFLVNADSSLTALTPASTFNKAGTGSAAIASQFWAPQTVTINGHFAGENLNFKVRAWLTSAGSYDASPNARGESATFAAALGGASSDPSVPPSTPSNLLNLKSFTVTVVPEPTVLALGVLGASALLLRRRK